jgi:hypothetical protein
MRKMPVLQGALPIPTQANAIAFDADGNIYVGTQCDGLAIAQAADNYTTWRVVRAGEEYGVRTWRHRAPRCSSGTSSSGAM